MITDISKSSLDAAIMISENSKILSSKITSVSSGKQKKLTKEIKKAKLLGLI